MSADKIAILRIELVDIEPPIWRRIAVRTSTSLQSLHKIIQAAMGWQDYHLWEFEADEVRYGLPEPGGGDWDRIIRPASSTRLTAILDTGVDEFLYTYDMGDGWLHRIGVEQIELAAADQLYPMFLGGERRCPPEDCGGVPGYYDFIDAISAPDKSRRRKKMEALDWYGAPYEPDDIDEEQIKISLNRIAKSHRTRKRAAS